MGGISAGSVGDKPAMQVTFAASAAFGMNSGIRRFQHPANMFR